jgi:hypothetical protein
MAPKQPPKYNSIDVDFRNQNSVVEVGKTSTLRGRYSCPVEVARSLSASSAAKVQAALPAGVRRSTSSQSQPSPTFPAGTAHGLDDTGLYPHVHPVATAAREPNRFDNTVHHLSSPAVLYLLCS